MISRKPLIIMVLAAVMTACNQQAATDTATVPVLTPFATVQEIMLSVVDPNVDPIWNAVSTTVTKDGVEEKAPATDAEWATLRQHAIVLIETANLLQIPGRQVAVAGASTSIHPVEQDPKAIEQLIRDHQTDFAQKALGLQEAAKVALLAIDEKSPDALLKAGEGIEHACEACHAAYWYPNDKRPLSFNHLGGAAAGVYARLRGVLASS